MKNSVDLNGIKIGDDYKPQLIGEIGQNHNGSVKIAKQLIDMSALCDIKFVKFQKRDIKTEFTKEAYNTPYDNKNSFGSIYGKHREFLELNKEEHLELKQYAEDKGLIYFCTPCDIPSLNILEEINCPFYKVASRDITNIPLLEALGKIGKSVIISTGMADYEDIDLALKTLNLPTSNVIIMQCTSEYPCPPENCNLNVIKTLRSKYTNVIGFSDHSTGILAATLSITLGANIIEKHITLDRCMKGTDQIGSLEFEGLKKCKKYIDDVPLYLGKYEKEVDDNVIYAKYKLMKSLTSKCLIKKGNILEEHMLCLKCPGNGILWKNKDKIIGKVANRDIDEDTTLNEKWFD